MTNLNNSFLVRGIVATSIMGATLFGINNADAQLLQENEKPIAEAITVVFWVVGLIVEAIKRRRAKRGR
jgi:hypothetical protein